MKGPDQNAFGDDHMKNSAFKRKTVPVQDNSAVKSTNKPARPLGGKLVDDLSKNSLNSRTATAEGLVNKRITGQTIDQALPEKDANHNHHSLGKQNFQIAGKRNQLSSANSMSESRKHDSSEAQTAPKTETKPSERDEEESDQLLESQNSKIEALRLSGLLNRELFTYLYDEDLDGQDTEDFKKVIKLQKELEDLVAESNDPQLINSQLNDQMESLDRIRLEIAERERSKKIIEEAAESFKTKSGEIADIPEDYQEVVDRVSEELINERRTIKFDHNELEEIEDQQNESDFLKSVQKKLMTTYYGFSNQQPEVSQHTEAYDDSYRKGIERIRHLDKILSEKEREEKAIKDVIRQARKREAELEIEMRMSNPNPLDKNVSGVSNNSSKSDFFMTQNKKINPIKKTMLAGSKNVDTLDSPSSNQASGKPLLIKSTSKQLPQQGNQPSVSSSQIATESERENGESYSIESPQGLQSRIDHLQKNIKNAFGSDHERFLNAMPEHTLKRYNELLNEIEEGLDSDDPEQFRKVSELHYQNVYYYPPELQERFEPIDARIIEMMEADPKISKNPRADVLRARAEEREAKRRIKEIDEKLVGIQLNEFEASPEQRDQLLHDILAGYTEEQLQAVKQGVDMLAFEELEDLDEEAIDLLKGIDFDLIEKNLESALEVLEDTEKKIKEQEANEAELVEVIDPEAIAKTQAFTDDYTRFLQDNKLLLEEFKVSEKISTEEDLDSFEQMTMEKLRSNGDMLEKWYSALDSGREELDRLEIENKIALDSVNSVKIRDPNNFDEELTAELKAKYPHIFKDKKPLPIFSDDDEALEEVQEETQEEVQEQTIPDGSKTED